MPEQRLSKVLALGSTVYLYWTVCVFHETLFEAQALLVELQNKPKEHACIASHS